MSRFLYKYRSLNPEDKQSVQQSRDLLVFNQLWLSSPSNFNDPFDMRASFELEGSAKDRRIEMDAWMREQRVPLRDRESRIAKIASLGPDKLLARCQETNERVVRGLGVCSFARDRKSILMWSHYADSHSGYCVGFERARDPATLITALPVKYRIKHPTVRWNGRSNLDDIGRMALTKHCGWSYESESRIVRHGAAGTKLPINPGALTLLILGCTIQPAAESALRDLMRERRDRGMQTPAVYRATRHNTRYAIRVERCEL